MRAFVRWTPKTDGEIIEIYYVVSGGANVRSLDFTPFKTLVSAYSHHHQGIAWPPAQRNLLRKSPMIIADSGMIGAMIDGVQTWKDENEKVAQFGELVDADLVATLDMPCEPNFLENVNLTLEKALNITIRNAKWRLDHPINRKTIWVVQGQKLQDYQWCAEEMEAIGCFSEGWVGLGTTCRRTPREGLYSIARWARSRWPDRHIHAFGVGQPTYIAELDSIGIDSTDTGGPANWTAFNQIRYQNLKTPNSLPLDYYAHLFHVNVLALEREIEIAKERRTTQMIITDPFLDREVTELPTIEFTDH